MSSGPWAAYPKGLDASATIVPVGLNFGPKWISVSVSIVTVGTPSSQVCRDFYQETVNKTMQKHLDVDDSSRSAPSQVPTEERSAELVQAFAHDIEAARQTAVSSVLPVLPKNPLFEFKVIAITVPEHWDISARTVVAKAAKLAGQPLDSSSMILKLPQAILLSFKMRKDTAGRCLTMLVHYHEAHLHLMLVQMLDRGYAVEGEVYLPHLGEDAMRKATTVSSVDAPGYMIPNRNSPIGSSSLEELDRKPPTDTCPTGDYANKGLTAETLTSIASAPEEPLPEPFTHEKFTPERLTLEEPTPQPSTSTQPAHGYATAFENIHPAKYPGDLQPILEALQMFLVLTTLPRTPDLTQEKLPHVLKHALRDVRYIVVHGNSRPEARKALRTAFRKAFADMDWLKVAQDVGGRGSWGAKIAAEMQLQNPKHLGDWADFPGYSPEEDA